MSNSCPLLVIRACKLLILLSYRGIIVRDSVFLKKPNQCAVQAPDHLTFFFFCIFAPSVLTRITSVAWLHLLHEDLFS